AAPPRSSGGRVPAPPHRPAAWPLRAPPRAPCRPHPVHGACAPYAAGSPPYRARRTGGRCGPRAPRRWCPGHGPGARRLSPPRWSCGSSSGSWWVGCSTLHRLHSRDEGGCRAAPACAIVRLLLLKPLVRQILAFTLCLLGVAPAAARDVVDSVGRKVTVPDRVEKVMAAGPNA